MASDTKVKANPISKKEAPVESKSTEAVGSSKAEGEKSASAAPSDYSRGEGQKPVSQAYRDNWSLIFAKKNAKKKAKKK